MTHEGALIASVGARLKQLRRDAGLTQQVMADRIEVGLRYYQQFESGRQNLTLRSLARLASALGVSPDRLLGDAGARVMMPTTHPPTPTERP